MESNEVIDNIRESFLNLLTEKPYESITVNDISQRAFINRATFYRYFMNKEELLSTLLDTFLKYFDNLQKENIDYSKYIDMSKQDEIKGVLYPNTFEILEYFRENKLLVTAFMSPVNHFDFMKILHNPYYNHFIQTYPKIFYQKLDKEVLEYYSLFMTNGVSSICERWFKTNFSESVEKTTDRILNILSSNLQHLYIEITQNDD